MYNWPVFTIKEITFLRPTIKQNLRSRPDNLGPGLLGSTESRDCLLHRVSAVSLDSISPFLLNATVLTKTPSHPSLLSVTA